MAEVGVYQVLRSRVVNPISEWVTKRMGHDLGFIKSSFSMVGNPLHLDEKPEPLSQPPAIYLVVLWPSLKVSLEKCG